MNFSVALKLASLERTVRLGQKLGELALPGDVITLAGGLGTGKTTLTQAIGNGLGVPPHYYITSPTFSLLHEYPGRITLYHMDLYRLADEEEIAALGFEDYIYSDGVTVIEWPDRLGSLLPEVRLQIELSFLSEKSREARLTCHGEIWEERLPSILEAVA